MGRKKMVVPEEDGFIPCPAIKELPKSLQQRAAELAQQINPANYPLLSKLLDFILKFGAAREADMPQKEALAVLTTKYWGAGGVSLRVAFLDSAAQNLKDRILSHMNAWQKYANVKFEPGSLSNADVRITFQRGGGYWSYLGTDIKMIGKQAPTMNLDSFSMDTPEGEYLRVVRHETGHTLGFPHEHMRQELVNRLDRTKTINYFRSQYGWSEQQTVSNVLTPISASSIMATPEADEDSIMCYQLPGAITKDGRPIPGGDDINANDAGFCNKIYPKSTPPDPVDPPPTGTTVRVVVLPDQKKVRIPTDWTSEPIPPA